MGVRFMTYALASWLGRAVLAASSKAIVPRVLPHSHAHHAEQVTAP